MYKCRGMLARMGPDSVAPGVSIQADLLVLDQCSVAVACAPQLTIPPHPFAVLGQSGKLFGDSEHFLRKTSKVNESFVLCFSFFE